MKRCTQCNFIYLDTDEVCDLDGAPLVFESEADLEAAKKAESPTETITTDLPPGEVHAEIGPKSSSKGISRNTLILAALAILMLVVGLLIGVYYSVSQREKSKPLVQENTAPPVEPSTTSTSSAPTPSPSVEPSPVARPSPSPKTNLARAQVSANPVSTGADQKNKSSSSTIRLANGAKIEADEVWRTKEGIWYRRQGMVTLLKPNRVQTIEKR
jgi:cytoskeletal protein RodZ